MPFQLLMLPSVHTCSTSVSSPLIENVAGHKAGIFKAGIPQTLEVAAVLQQQAAEKDVKLKCTEDRPCAAFLSHRLLSHRSNETPKF